MAKYKSLRQMPHAVSIQKLPVEKRQAKLWAKSRVVVYHGTSKYSVESDRHSEGSDPKVDAS